MSYKIEIFYNSKKNKHKLYDSQETYDRWWDERKKDVDRYVGSSWFKMGIVGYIDGTVDKSYGDVPTKYKIEK